MKRIQLLFLAFVMMIGLAFTQQTASAQSYYYKWNGYSGGNYTFVTSKAFKNAVKYGKVTVNKRTVAGKMKPEAFEKSSEAMLEYGLMNPKLKSKYIQRKYDTVFILNDQMKVYAIDMPVKKGKITKQQFIKTYGKKYGEIQFKPGETSVNYKFKKHYFEGVFNKKNRLIRISFSARVGGQLEKDADSLLFGA
ncbi:immunodominant staphylococcal antigen IsaB family protein [Macrococcoides caseolyticum]|uniref:immunodominant staphylococcal antigen IsaB family protein n=1 Tax=Macrococcoides caseolyticum TaxID=69966 RepID=UPI001F2B4221|nr:hypothetical protein [Macrococcus caseolyticus]MCE4956058.1 hypothetical protein [Macrococcus caseolyticus]